MRNDDAPGGGKAGVDDALLDFEFEDLDADSLRLRKKPDVDEDIIELVNPIKRGETPEDILEGISSLETEARRSGRDAASAEPELGPLDKEIEAIFATNEAGHVPPAPQKPSPTAAYERASAPETAYVPGISEERLEAMISKAVGDAVERVARQAIEAAAEKAVREAIEALRESLKVPRI